MNELLKINCEGFKEYYIGTNGQKKVVCILDKNCVRYMVYTNGKLKSKREFSNGKEDICFKNAMKALNK